MNDHFETLDPRKYGWLLQSLRNIHGNDVFEVRAPILWPGMAEGSFNLNFHGKIARLARSNALYLLMMASKYGNCYLIQKSFRQEKEYSPFHLSEFDLFDCCLCNVDFEQLIDKTEQMLRLLLKNAKTEFPDSCKAILPDSAFKRYEWKELFSLYEGFSEISFKRTPGKELLQLHQEPFFITNIPQQLSSSWLVKKDQNNQLCSFDLFLPGVGEVFEGSERPNSKKEYVSLFSQSPNLHKKFKWLLDEFTDVEGPISIYGCGIERLAMWLFGIKDINLIQKIYRKAYFSELP